MMIIINKYNLFKYNDNNKIMMIAYDDKQLI